MTYTDTHPASATTRIYAKDGTHADHPFTEASRIVRTMPNDWSLNAPDPIGWEKEKPRYRATRELYPAPKERMRTEPPISEMGDPNTWQYAENRVAEGEIVETDCWPHESMKGENFAGRKIVEHFNREMKSRLARSPVLGGIVVLQNGFGSAPGPTPAILKPPSLKFV